jgi:hypothetical protein
VRAVTPQPVIEFFIERENALAGKMEAMIEKENKRKGSPRWESK